MGYAGEQVGRVHKNEAEGMNIRHVCIKIPWGPSCKAGGCRSTKAEEWGLPLVRHRLAPNTLNLETCFLQSIAYGEALIRLDDTAPYCGSCSVV